MQSRKKILILVTRAELGGAQNHISSLVKNLHSDINFVLCTGTTGPLTNTFKALGLTAYIVPGLDKKHFMSSVIAIIRIITKEQPHLVHTHSAVASFVGRIAAKLLRKKTLYTVHGWHFVPNSVNKRRLLGPILERIAKPFTNHWITVSAYDKVLGLQKNVLVADRCSIIENGIENLPVSPKADRQNNTFSIAFVGRATYQKNCLAAVKIIERCNPQIYLSIFSANGDHLPVLRKLIDDKNLNKQITVIDNESEAGKQLKYFDALLMTSRYEGMPLCALESMRASLPIVATDVCGMNEIVQHGKNGYLFDLNNIDQASSYLNELLKQPEKCLEMGKNSRSIFEKNHLEAQMIKKTVIVYENLLGVI